MSQQHRNSSNQAQPLRADHQARSKSLRSQCPRRAHVASKALDDRPDPLHTWSRPTGDAFRNWSSFATGACSNLRLPSIAGAALNMAADLATTPTTGLRVQACGDCHLCNFGAFATPERRVIADINVLDESLPAPWEWDVKRLAASFVLPCRNNGFSEQSARDAVLACVRVYRERMAEYSDMRVMDVWYARIDQEALIPTIEDKVAYKRIQRRLAKARDRSVLEHDFPELVTTTGGAPTIRDNPPLIYHPREWEDETFSTFVQNALAAYRESLPENRRLLLDRFKLMDMAVKVVGVGSVGTACAIMLLMAGEQDPLFFQVK